MKHNQMNKALPNDPKQRIVYVTARRIATMKLITVI